MVQGLLGDCWLLSAIAVVAQRPDRLQRIFAPMEGAPDGCVRVQLFVAGAWQTITTDDRLPCDAEGRLLYARSLELHETWVPLLEKCFAKLYGTYEHLISGFADAAMRDLTGGAPQRLRLSRALVEASAAAAAGRTHQQALHRDEHRSSSAAQRQRPSQGSAKSSASASEVSNPSSCGRPSING